jgi:hypothetical protein
VSLRQQELQQQQQQQRQRQRYDAAKFPMGLSSLGLMDISGVFLRGPPPPTA